MNLRHEAVLSTRTQDLLRLFDGEEPLVAEDIDELGKLLPADGRDHLPTDQVHILLLAAFIGPAYGMSSEESARTVIGEVSRIRRITRSILSSSSVVRP